jgi:hypothetical protein
LPFRPYWAEALRAMLSQLTRIIHENREEGRKL